MNHYSFKLSSIMYIRTKLDVHYDHVSTNDTSSVATTCQNRIFGGYCNTHPEIKENICEI